MRLSISKLSVLLIAAFFVALCPLAAQAQDATPQEGQQTTAQKPMHHHSMEVTGCLQKGDEAGEYMITGEDGKTYDLRSHAVKLSEHVGHKVTITGVRHHETKSEEANEEKTEKDQGNKAGATDHPDLTVTRLKMISETCTQ